MPLSEIESFSLPSFSRLAENWRLKHIRKKTPNNWDNIFADAHLNSKHTPQEFSALLVLRTIRIKNSRAPYEMGLAQGCRAFRGCGPTAAIGVPKRSSEFPVNSTVRWPGQSQDVCCRPRNHGAFYNVLSQRSLDRCIRLCFENDQLLPHVSRLRFLDSLTGLTLCSFEGIYNTLFAWFWREWASFSGAKARRFRRRP